MVFNEHATKTGSTTREVTEQQKFYVYGCNYCDETWECDARLDVDAELDTFLIDHLESEHPEKL